jgi:hypothetical protein
MDETTQKMRAFVYEDIEDMIKNKAPIHEGSMSLYVQFRILDQLEITSSQLSNIEDAIVKLNPLYRD